MIENFIYICGGKKLSIDAKGEHCESIERLKLSRETGVVQGSKWETLNVACPKLVKSLIVPISSEEILFIGRIRDSNLIGVSLLSLVDLKWTDPTSTAVGLSLVDLKWTDPTITAVGYAPEMQSFE